MGPDHAPLSKRHGATSVKEFRERGYLPEALTNYLALIGWSPGAGEELLPLDELARRFRLENVGHSAGVFDVEKLAWVNRHYLKSGAPDRLALLGVPFLQRAGWLDEPTRGDIAFLTTVLPAVASTVDRLDQVPARLRFLFEYSAERALASETIAAEAVAARPVVDALADELTKSEPLVDRESFRGLASRVKARSGRTGKALFHPIRLVLTGEAEGLELDVAVPAIERGAGLEAPSGLGRIPGARERAAEFARQLGAR